MAGEIINVRIKPDKHTVLAELTILDQIKLIFSHFINKESEELDAAKTVSLNELKEKAEFITIIDNAIKELEEHSSVTILVTSKYQLYAQEMLNDKDGLGRYYDFQLDIPDLPISVKHTFKIRIARKNDSTITNRLQMASFT